ncbi:MAG: DUF4288 domain-containing protein [Verrucomicrobiaceae bacterium]|nr:DUF4288 domain-containing protein [Verrucomicrobiaceae bacterium]
MPFYSAKLHVICLVDDPSVFEDEGGHLCDYAIVVFRAADFEAAWHRALELGRAQEHGYENAEGNQVRWAFRGIEDIEELGEDIDGMEVGSVLDIYKPEEPLPFDTEFNPEKHLPDWMTRPLEK